MSEHPSQDPKRPFRKNARIGGLGELERWRGESTDGMQFSGFQKKGLVSYLGIGHWKTEINFLDEVILVSFLLYLSRCKMCSNLL